VSGPPIHSLCCQSHTEERFEIEFTVHLLPAVVTKPRRVDDKNSKERGPRVPHVRSLAPNIVDGSESMEDDEKLQGNGNHFLFDDEPREPILL
jgi:hypothetical protein